LPPNRGTCIGWNKRNANFNYGSDKVELIVVSEKRLAATTAPLLEEAKQLKAILTTIKKNSDADDERGG